jgi:hypothetical protein
MDFENMVFCQSCMMPMNMGEGEKYGTEKDGSMSADYCSYCYENGAFKKEETMEEMIEVCIPFTIEAGVFKTAEEARADMLQSYPKLKRWAS